MLRWLNLYQPEQLQCFASKLHDEIHFSAQVCVCPQLWDKHAASCCCMLAACPGWKKKPRKGLRWCHVTLDLISIFNSCAHAHAHHCSHNTLWSQVISSVVDMKTAIKSTTYEVTEYHGCNDVHAHLHSCQIQYLSFENTIFATCHLSARPSHLLLFGSLSHNGPQRIVTIFYIKLAEAL